MKEFMMKMIPVQQTDQFPFRCMMCSTCCKHVKQSVPIESLDAFRLAKFLRNSGEDIQGMEEVLGVYAEPVLLHTSCYTVFMLKTLGDEDACIFLKGNKCRIHGAKPRACRTYPISVGLDGQGVQEQYLSVEQTHHFNGPQMSVKKWIQRRCTKEDFDFWKIDTGSANEIANLLEAIPENGKSRALLLFQHYKYWQFDLDKPFIEQFRHNNQTLVTELRKLAGEE